MELKYKEMLIKNSREKIKRYRSDIEIFESMIRRRKGTIKMLESQIAEEEKLLEQIRKIPEELMVEVLS